MEWIREAMDQGRENLSEYESKKVLAAYDIPVTRERLVRRREDLLAVAAEIDFPWVLKGCGADIAHKTEHGLVQIDVRNEAEAAAVFERFTAAMDGHDAAVLVQEMVFGRRELAAGMTRDPQFGPCVMFGLGGIFAEIFKDTVFRVAPLEEADALDMMDEIQGHRILDAVRGMAAADLQRLAQILVRVGRIGLEHPAVAEIDVNPIILDAEGRPVAADALIVLKEPF